MAAVRNQHKKSQIGLQPAHASARRTDQQRKRRSGNSTNIDGRKGTVISSKVEETSGGILDVFSTRPLHCLWGALICDVFDIDILAGCRR